MKKFFTLFLIALVAVLPVMAQNSPLEAYVTNGVGAKVSGKLKVQESRPHKVLPVYSDELIDEAPAGKVVSGCQRSGFSYYYSNGGLNGGYNDGFVGEYVLGDDGCIYIKEACASVKAGTYLKLDKIDDENYVAHTAQLIMVYDSGMSVYSYFATRLVFKQYEETQYGYAVETDEWGNELCDIYFTYKDGVLKQKDQTVVEMNGETFPHEMIGFTNASGGWIGYGDGCITFTSKGLTPNVLPAGAEVKQGSYTYSTMSSTTGENVKNAMLTQYAEVGDDFYMLSPTDGKNWIKGEIDRIAQTVTFKTQYVGLNEEIGCHQWFMPATYNTWRDVWDVEDGSGTWVRDFTASDAYVCKYVNGSVISDPNSKQTMVLSLSGEAIQVSAAYSLFSVKPYEHKLSKPATPVLLRFSPLEETFFWGEIVFAASPIDENDVYIPEDELYYCIYLNSDKPYLFTTDDFGKIPSDMTDIPYLYDDDYEFDCNGAFHNIYFYEGGIKSLGIQAIHKMDGQEMRSDICWWGEVPSSINSVADVQRANAVKMLEKNRVVILKNGVKYNINGQIIR